MNLSLAGLSIICLAWLIQLFWIIQKEKKLSAFFVLIYCLGVILLIIDGWQSQLINLALLNGLSFFIALLVLFSLFKKS